MPILRKKYLCGICRKQVRNNTNAIFCDGDCALWYHLDCLGNIQLRDFIRIVKLGDKVLWFCEGCVRKHNERRNGTSSQMNESETVESMDEISFPIISHGALDDIQAASDASNQRSTGFEAYSPSLSNKKGDFRKFQEDVHQAALDLIEEIPIDCTCVVLIYYKSDESLMIGKSMLVRDGRLWEESEESKRQKKAVEDPSFPTHARIVNKFLRLVNSMPSKTVYIPVELSPQFKLSGLRRRPIDYGYDIVVMDGRVYFSDETICNDGEHDHHE